MTEIKYDYSQFETGIGHNLMTQINAAANEQVKAEAEVERLEEELRAAQKRVLHIKEHVLPELMDAAGMTKIKTDTGVEVAVYDIFRGSLNYGDVPKGIKWLEENNSGDLIKREFKISFDRDEEEWAAKFERDLRQRKKEVRMVVNRTVNPQTLCAFAKEQMEAGVNVPMDILGLTRLRQARIKLPK